MLVISSYKIGQMQGIIPNLDSIPEFTMSVTEPNQYTKLIKYNWNGDKLLELEINTAYNSISVEDYSSVVAQDSGLFIDSPYSGLAIFDALYYKANQYKLNLARKSDDQLLKICKRIKTRLEKRQVSGRSWYSKKVINEFVNFIVGDSIPKPTEASSLDDIRTYINHVQSELLIRGADYYGLLYSIRFDIATLSWIDQVSGTRIRTRTGEWYTTTRSILKTRYNLTHAPNSLYSSSGTYINTETEIIYQGNIYLKTELELEACPSCGLSVQSRDRLDDGCVHCMKELSKIHNYSTRVPSLLKFKATKVKPSTLYLGTELEYESTDGNQTKDAVFANKSLRNHAILKSDGSIRNGFEIVTCPATLDIHLVEFKKFFGELKEKSKLHGDSNTGMHVHISRKPLSMLTIGKMTAFLNDSKNKNFIESIAGRKLNHFCNQSTERTVSFPLVFGKGERYNTLNLNNDETVEIRIFSTPETYEDFAYKLEFSEALAVYCSPCNANHSVANLLKHSNFQAWVNDKKHSYPHLVNKLKTIQG